MKPLKKRLLSLKEDIRIAIIGAGAMGKGLVYQAYATPGMRPVAIADVKIEKAIACAQALNRDYEIVKYVDTLNRAVERGRLAITDNGELVSSSELINVMIEASGATTQGGIHAMKAIRHHQHVVMMNDEAGLMYGPLLLQMANEEGVVYTACDGSYPATLKKLTDDLDFWGLDLVIAGKIEGDVDRYANSTKVLQAFSQQRDYKASCADGTKACIEMAILANAINGRAAVPGTYGYRCSGMQDVIRQYDVEKIRKSDLPVVGYISSAGPEDGVFAVGYTDQAFQQEMLRPGIGAGPYYIFHRPFYTGYVEAMECVMEAYFNGTSRLQPSYGMKTNVFAYAKKELKQGAVLDGIGGHQTYGLIENLDDNKHYPGLPVCLAGGLKLKSDIDRDQLITLDDVDYDADDISFSLYFRALHANTQKTVIPKTRVSEDNLQFVIPM
jgi:predicted homoserine dehydrogenase-like protein